MIIFLSATISLLLTDNSKGSTLLFLQDYPRDRHPGWNKGSIAYHAGGFIFSFFCAIYFKTLLVLNYFYQCLVDLWFQMMVRYLLAVVLEIHLAPDVTKVISRYFTWIYSHAQTVSKLLKYTLIRAAMCILHLFEAEKLHSNIIPSLLCCFSLPRRHNGVRDSLSTRL